MKIKININIWQYFIYLIRWQLSTPILAIVFILLTTINQFIAAIIANLIGGLIFYWVDKSIFQTGKNLCVETTNRETSKRDKK